MVVAQRDAAAAQVGEELGTVVVELLALDLGDAVLDEAGGDVLFLVLAELLHNEHAVDELLDDVILQGLELLVEFLLVLGLALQLGDQWGNFAADVVHRDDLFLGDGRNAVGKAQVQPVVGGGLRETGRNESGGKEGEGKAAA